MLKLGIIGLPQSGKTTVLNALSGAQAAVGDYSTSKSANIVVVKVPDARLERVAEIFQPKKVTHAEIEYIDIAGLTRGASSDPKKEAAYIHSLRQADALIQVVRCFEEANVPHPDGSIDPRRDIAEVDSELILADLVTIENRLIKLERNIKIAKKDEEKAEYNILKKMNGTLESEKPLRSLELSEEESRVIAGFGFLTLKPMLYVINLGEDQLKDRDRLESGFRDLTGLPKSGLASICASLQMDIAELNESDRADFMAELGLKGAASDLIIQKSFELLGMIAFFTGSDPEVRSWPVRRGITAHDAAGEVHSDMQRGFIKAEVVAFDDLDRLGSWSKARDEGKLHLHGKDYIVQDGDIILFRFNV